MCGFRREGTRLGVRGGTHQTVAAPHFMLHSTSIETTAATPAADCSTLFAHLPGQRASLNGARGQKWLDVP